MQVTVVGAGVIGLSAAVELARAGHDVRVLAERTGAATTSAVAGAIWFPYRAGPRERVARWAARTYERLVAIAAAHPEAGVDVLTAFEITPDEAPWWLPAVPGARRVVVGGRAAWRFAAPRVEPEPFLAWLAAQLPRAIERARVERLEEVPGDVVVNCTGLGARRLAGDVTVSGLAGQVLVCDLGEVARDVTIADDSDEAALFYAIPRRGELILGGSAVPVAGADPPPEDAELSARILADARRLGLRPGAVREARRALRPLRPVVRLEREGRVVHCYGHGGAGFTLCLGCAEEVVTVTGG